MCTPRRMSPTSSSDTASCLAASKRSASSSSLLGRQGPRELALAPRVLVRLHRRQLVAGASGGLERVARGAALRLQGRAAQAEPPFLLLVLELPLPARRQPVGHQRSQLGRAVGELAVVGRRHLQHAQEGRPRRRDGVIRGGCADHRPRAMRARKADMTACGSRWLSTPLTTPGLAIRPSRAPRWTTMSASATTTPPRRSRTSSATTARSSLGPAADVQRGRRAAALDRAAALPPTPGA